MRNVNIKNIEKRIGRLKLKILEMDSFLPGSLTKQYNVCGTKNCRCKDPDNPKKHGPYYQLAYYKDGKHTTSSIPKDLAPQVKIEIANYKRIKKLMDDLISTQLKLTMLKITIKKKEKVAARKNG